MSVLSCGKFWRNCIVFPKAWYPPAQCHHCVCTLFSHFVVVYSKIYISFHWTLSATTMNARFCMWLQTNWLNFQVHSWSASTIKQVSPSPPSPLLPQISQKNFLSNLFHLSLLFFQIKKNHSVRCKKKWVDCFPGKSP